MMRIIRSILAVIIQFFDALIPVGPKVERSVEEQARVDRETGALSVYQFVGCPFCVRVRRAARRLNLKLEYRDVLKDKQAERELLEGGGERQTPCLRIREGDHDRWMYESAEIIGYLEKRFGGTAA